MEYSHYNEYGVSCRNEVPNPEEITALFIVLSVMYTICKRPKLDA
jgi:hypothetical protein